LVIRPRVRIITTGGTIAGKLLPSGTVAPGLGPEDMLARIPAAAAYAVCDVDPWLEVPSSAISFHDMLHLSTRVKDALANPELAGIVITHGTGTLEQTAYFLDVTLDTDRPVVVTGAMRNPTLPSDDGPLNLFNAIQVAACERSRGLGVLVVMNGTIHCARDVTKSSSANAAAFQSPEFGPLGAIDEDYVFYARRPFARIPAVLPQTITARVERIPFVADPGDLLLRAALETGEKAGNGDSGSAGPSPAKAKLLAEARKTEKLFEESMEDDFNSAKAQGHLFDLAKAINRVAESGRMSEVERAALPDATATLRRLGETLGLFWDAKRAQEAVPDEVQAIVRQRDEARLQKQWQKADELRDKILALGYVLEDQKGGTRARRKL